MIKRQAVSYSEKLKDPRWQKVRLQIFERDNWQCQLCGNAAATLHVHHAYYRGKTEPWEYDQNSLHTVCEGCHEHADCIRVDLQHEMAQLPIKAQEKMIVFVAWLNCMYADDINAFLENRMPNLPDLEEIKDSNNHRESLGITQLNGECLYRELADYEILEATDQRRWNPVTSSALDWHDVSLALPWAIGGTITAFKQQRGTQSNCVSFRRPVK